MNQSAVHKQQYTRNQADLYLAFELGKKEWKMGFSVGFGQKPPEIVVSVGDLAGVNRRARRAKTDRMDLRKLLGMLMRYDNGERKVWSVVRLPTVDEEDSRQFHRELSALRGERTRHINRTKGLLASYGVRIRGRS